MNVREILFFSERLDSEENESGLGERITSLGRPGKCVLAAPLGGEQGQNRGHHILSQTHSQPTALAPAADPEPGSPGEAQRAGFTGVCYILPCVCRTLPFRVGGRGGRGPTSLSRPPLRLAVVIPRLLAVNTNTRSHDGPVFKK